MRHNVRELSRPMVFERAGRLGIPPKHFAPHFPAIESAQIVTEVGLHDGLKVKDRESLESALRRFKKKCERSGILSDIRKHQHFEKPSERRKRKANAARRKVASRLLFEPD